MQLVQRTMLPQSGPSELAEVLLSGLLSRADGGGGRGQWYAFEPGVQEALLGPLGRDEALLVLKHCSEYIETRFGKGGPNFPALAFAQLGDGGAGDSSYATGSGTTGIGYRDGESDRGEENEENEDSEESETGGGIGGAAAPVSPMPLPRSRPAYWSDSCPCPPDS